MISSRQSYAQSLRVIGQALETLRIDAFSIEKIADKYIVYDWESSYLKGLANEVWGPSGAARTAARVKNSRNVLEYSGSDTERLDAQERSRRGTNDGQDNNRIPSSLRVVGDYLDRERAVGFEILWTNGSVRVRLETASGVSKETEFTLQNLQDSAVGMYLRRSIR